MVEPAKIQNWHACDLKKVFELLFSTGQGLSSSEAAERLRNHGPNILPTKPGLKWWQIALHQFQNPLIYILAAAVVISLLVHEYVDAAFIIVVMLLNAVIGGYQEWRAQQSSQALQKLLRIRASVIRDGMQQEISAEQLVQGDLVLIESGNKIPADLRFLQTQSLEINESLLTGESLAVVKDSGSLCEAATPISDRHNMAHAGSTVVRGRGRGIVVATGAQTAVGQLALDVVAAVGGKPPLLERMEKFTKVIAVGVLLIAVIIGVIGVNWRGFDASEMLIFCIALAVSAIPEGLPIAMTVALAVMTTRMAKRGVIVRRLAAVEGLGSCTMIASDKTGTLTCNELTVRRIALPDGREYNVSGEGFAPAGHLYDSDENSPIEMDATLESLIRCGALCNESELQHTGDGWGWHGDPTDIALLSLAAKAGFDYNTANKANSELNLVPFESEYQYAASYRRIFGDIALLVKGAPEKVLAMCTDRSNNKEVIAVVERMAAEGFRVLALAEGRSSEEALGSRPSEIEPTLKFLGLVAMIDPLRNGVKEAVESCHRAGIEVIMITGDHPVTALAIARELGLADSTQQVVAGKELQGKSEEELKEWLQQVKVFARVTPHQKLELVRAAKAAGHYVAVTGDGVNDAPALRAANIGVSMGRAGTDVAREASEIVISDDNFATIVAGVEAGRVAYDNVRKVVYLLISTAVAEVLLLGGAVVAGMPLPLLPVQLLWLNLVTNGIQDVALAFEPSEGDVLNRKPRPPREPIFNRLMIERVVVGAAVMALIGFVMFAWLLSIGTEESSARNLLLLLMVLFQNVHVANSRSETKSAFKHSLLLNPILLVGVLLAQGLHIAATYSPLGHTVLKTESISFAEWLALLPLAFMILLAIELHKYIWSLRQRTN